MQMPLGTNSQEAWLSHAPLGGLAPPHPHAPQAGQHPDYFPPQGPPTPAWVEPQALLETWGAGGGMAHATASGAFHCLLPLLPFRGCSSPQTALRSPLLSPLFLDLLKRAISSFPCCLQPYPEPEHCLRHPRLPGCPLGPPCSRRGQRAGLRVQLPFSIPRPSSLCRSPGLQVTLTHRNPLPPTLFKVKETTVHFYLNVSSSFPLPFHHCPDPLGVESREPPPWSWLLATDHSRQALGTFLWRKMQATEHETPFVIPLYAYRRAEKDMKLSRSPLRKSLLPSLTSHPRSPRI